MAISYIANKLYVNYDFAGAFFMSENDGVFVRAAACFCICDTVKRMLNIRAGMDAARAPAIVKKMPAPMA